MLHENLESHTVRLSILNDQGLILLSKKDMQVYIVVVRVTKFSGIQPEPNFSRSGMYPTLPEPDLMKQNIKFGVKRT